MSARASLSPVPPSDVKETAAAVAEPQEPPAEEEGSGSGSGSESGDEEGSPSDDGSPADPATAATASSTDSAEKEGAADDTAASGPGASSSSPPAPQTAWQAIWSPAHGAYYFYNATTQETTWVNPLQPEASTSAAATAGDGDSAGAASAAAGAPPEAPAHLRAMYQAQAAAQAAGIDPSLAHLDPGLALAGAAGAPAGGAYAASARFNARTGAFAKADARDPGHLSEFARMQRMSEFYFDTQQWERDVEKRKAEELAEEEAGVRKKKPTKKDLERFKEQKRQKKLAKTAWLRN